jgi:RNA polymerase alpha subunit
MDDLPLSDLLADVLFRQGYAYLGDLDGHTLADLTRHPGFGRECHRELRCLLETQGTIWSSTARATWSTPPAAPVVLADEVRPRRERATVERPVRAKPVRARPRKRLDRASVIRVPREHSQLRIEHMPVSARLYNALARNGYVVLGDLDGRSLGHLHQHRGFGRVCLEDLRGVLLAMRIVPAVPPEPILQVPTFAHEYRFDELRLSRPVQLFARHYGLSVLGDIHGIRLPPARASVIHALAHPISVGIGMPLGYWRATARKRTF